MPSFSTIVNFFTPWDLSPTVLIACAAVFAFYVRGMFLTHARGESTGFWRATAFLLSVLSIYLFMQTRLDYWSQHMFWVHRLQHLFLHHLAPFLIALSAPVVVLRRGTPDWLREKILLPIWHFPVTRMIYRIVQNPVIATFLFVGLIWFWLMPSIHFKAMLSVDRYKAMNWSMLIDGLLFWWLIIGPPKQSSLKPLHYGFRVLILWIVVVPQLLIGAYIALSSHILYSVYNVCGRAWPISPMTDQELGGLITWIPSCMMSVVAQIIVIYRWMHQSEEEYALSQSNPAPETQTHDPETVTP